MTGQVEITPRAAVLVDLRDGYGVEDIAINRKIPVASVRRIVMELRDDGILAQIQWNARDSDALSVGL